MKKITWVISTLMLAVLIYFIFFPAFAGRLIINPMITLGFFQIRWYGLILALSIFLAYFLVRKNSWKFGINKTDIDDYAFWVVICGILGARIYYVLFNYGYYAQNLSEIYKIWHGGMSIYGAILAGIIFSWIYVRGKAYTFFQLFDLVALSLPLAQAVGRLGNFVNQEAFGSPTDLPWKMYVAPKFRPTGFESSSFFHPTFLYEIILNVIVFLILRKLFGKVKSGIIGWSYLLLYSFGRFFIEAIRLDSFFLAGFRVDQVVAVVLFIIAGTVILLKQKNNTKLDIQG